MSNLINKAFEGHNIRIITDEQGEPWFVAKDVSIALGYRDAANMTRNLKEHQQGTQNVSTLSVEAVGLTSVALSCACEKTLATRKSIPDLFGDTRSGMSLPPD